MSPNHFLYARKQKNLANVDPTQPNPLKSEKSRPNPTQLNPGVNPTQEQLCCRLLVKFSLSASIRSESQNSG